MKLRRSKDKLSSIKTCQIYSIILAAISILQWTVRHLWYIWHRCATNDDWNKDLLSDLIDMDFPNTQRCINQCWCETCQLSTVNWQSTCQSYQGSVCYEQNNITIITLTTTKQRYAMMFVWGLSFLWSWYGNTKSTTYQAVYVGI